MNKIKTTRGVPIYNKQNEKCLFCVMPIGKKNGFPVCISTVNMYLYFTSNRWIISCADNYEKCKYYKTNMIDRYQRDIILISRYIEKYKDLKYKGLIVLTMKHKQWLFNKLSKAHNNYIRALMRYCGYELVISIDKDIIARILKKKLQQWEDGEIILYRRMV